MDALEKDEKEAKLEEVLRESEERTIEEKAGEYSLPYRNLATLPISQDALTLVSKREAETALLAVFNKDGLRIHVAIRDPKRLDTKKILERLKKEGYHVALSLVSDHSLKRAWARYPVAQSEKKGARRGFTVDPDVISRYADKVRTFEGIGRTLQETQTVNVSEILEVLLASAFRTDASDIHFEPEETGVAVRFRIDGVLHDIATLTPRVYTLVLSRIKLLSDLKLNVHTKAQDGRFSVTSPDRTEFEIRTSVIPTAYQESTVLRVLNPRSLRSIKELGMRTDLEKRMRSELKKPHGMVLVTGPSGSGKTTTHFAFLKYLVRPEVKIITLEDPIEYHLEGISQTEIDPEKGYDFAMGLKSILRQDPDVILLGEIRDTETAKIALEAALTGHLLLSTLHTNDAASTIPRLLELGIEARNIALALNAVVAERLVRRVCPQCKKLRKITKGERAKIKTVIASLPDSLKPKIDLARARIAEVKGCTQCFMSGYRGRTGIFEILIIEEALRETIETKTFTAFEKAMKSLSFTTLRHDGILRVLEGITTIDEIERVLGPLS